MRFVFYIDAFLNETQFKAFEEATIERFRKAGFLRDEDVLVCVQRPGYITEIVALAGE